VRAVLEFIERGERRVAALNAPRGRRTFA
jgi:hypothetical protein